jgi:lipopolysaccharide export system permease protein
VSRLDRYLAQQFFGPFIWAVMGFVVIGSVDIIFYLVEMTVVSHISWILLAKLLVYKLPSVMVIFFPMAVLFSVMINLIRMGKDNEITIFLASGISRLRLFTPWIAFGLVISLLAFLFNDKIVPLANRAFELTVQKQIQHNLFPKVLQEVVFRIENRFIYVHHADPKTKTIHTIHIFEPTATFPLITTAKTAKWALDKWTLLDGQSYQLNSEGTPLMTQSFKTLDVVINPALFNGYSPEKSASEMGTKELKRHILASQKSGLPTTTLWVEYHLKYSLPIACVIFSVLGVMICQLWSASNRGGWGTIIAITAGLFVSGLYFFLIAFTRAFAKSGDIHPFIGAWIPNFVYITLSLIAGTYLSVKK